MCVACIVKCFTDDCHLQQGHSLPSSVEIEAIPDHEQQEMVDVTEENAANTTNSLQTVAVQPLSNMGFPLQPKVCLTARNIPNTITSSTVCPTISLHTQTIQPVYSTSLFNSPEPLLPAPDITLTSIPEPVDVPEHVMLNYMVNAEFSWARLTSESETNTQHEDSGTTNESEINQQSSPLPQCSSSKQTKQAQKKHMNTKGKSMSNPKKRKVFPRQQEKTINKAMGQAILSQGSMDIIPPLIPLSNLVSNINLPHTPTYRHMVPFR